MKKIFQTLLVLFKKASQSFLLLLGIFFLFMSVSMGWNLFVDGFSVPTDEELVVECNAMIEEGSYKNFTEAEKLGACLEDSYKALGAMPLTIIFFPISILLAWIFLRFGLRVFKRQ